MSGYLNSVAARIEKDVPAALYLHCFAHCTNLYLQLVGRRCVVVRDALNLVIDKILSLKIYTVFKLNVQKESLKPLCPTRWTAHTAAISGVLNNYSTLLAALEQINTETHDDYDRKAGVILFRWTNLVHFGLKFAQLVLLALNNCHGHCKVKISLSKKHQCY